MIDEYEIQRIEADKKILKDTFDPMGDLLKDGFDSTSPQVVKDLCDLYYPGYGCLVSQKCCMPNEVCEHFEKACRVQIDDPKKGRNKKTKKTKLKIRYCECGIVLEKGKQYCKACKDKRRKESFKKQNKKRKGRDSEE